MSEDQMPKVLLFPGAAARPLTTADPADPFGFSKQAIALVHSQEAMRVLCIEFAAGMVDHTAFRVVASPTESYPKEAVLALLRMLAETVRKYKDPYTADRATDGPPYPPEGAA